MGTLWTSRAYYSLICLSGYELKHASNCIIIISTSVGQTNLKPSMSEDMEHKHFLNEIKSKFPGEFLSRLDQIVVFVSFQTSV